MSQPRGQAMTGIYTYGEWTVQEGREDEFVVAWQEFATWAIQATDGSTFAKLLRDADDPQLFVSFGPWRDRETADRWRQLPGFTDRVGRIRKMLDSFSARTLTVAIEVGPPTPDPW